MTEPRLFGKYLIAKADGTPLEPDARYFVVRYDAGADHGSIGRTVLRMYALHMSKVAPELATELLDDIDAETDKVATEDD